MSMVVHIGKVVSVYDDSDGLRIKVNVKHDTIEKSMIAFPLLPKTIQTVPKVDEAVLVIFSQLNNRESQRYYIGPIISQPQYMAKAPYNHNGEKSPATSLIDGSKTSPLPKISSFAITSGAFPEIEDVALVGRHTEDITLKDGEIDIRCGVRTTALGSENTEFDNPKERDANGLLGDVVFNSTNPGYIQMKYRKSKGESIINMVSDKINLLTYEKGKMYSIPLTNPSSAGQSKEFLIKTSDMDILMELLHPIPYGDKIVQALQIIMHVLENHVHSFPGKPATPDSTLMLSLVRSMDMVNNDIRIN